jgi:tetratricopeptide (TPR) repeat protein
MRSIQASPRKGSTLVTLLIALLLVDVLLFPFFLVEAVRGIRLAAEFGIAISAVAFKNLAGLLPEPKRGAARSITFSNKGRAFSDRAIADVKAALAINPQRARSHGFLGSLYQREGRVTEAEAEYRVALGIDPTEQLALEGLKKSGK